MKKHLLKIYKMTKFMKIKTTNFIPIFIALLFISVLSINTFGQNEQKKLPENYDAELASKLGADEYGMRQYVFVVLKTGKADVKDEKKRKELFAGHFANMVRLAKAGKLVLAGPFMEGGKKRGLFVFDVQTIEEANELVKTDPAVKAGIFDVELTRWYGSAALMQINEIHTKIQKTKIE